MPQPNRTDASLANDLFLFGGFRLDRRSGGLFREDAADGAMPVDIGGRALDVLGVLVAHHGELVSKQAIMQAVWPGIVVDEKNLAVQISLLRRILDDGRAGSSCIQTEAGRGYRFVAPATRLSHDDGATGRSLPSDEDAPAPEASVPDTGVPANIPRLARHRHGMWAGLVAIAVLVLPIGGSAGPYTDRPQSVIDAAGGAAPSAPSPAPRLSLVVLPFQNLGGDAKDDYLADAIADDLTTDLSQIAGAFVTARESAYTYKGKATDVRQIGRELGVRYILEGSVRRIGDTLRVNVQLISAETGAHLWSDRFDESISQLAAGQQLIIARMYDTIGFSVVDIEAARSLRERPTNPDAFDLILQARSLRLRQQTPERDKEIMALYERALALDPSSSLAMTGVAYQLIEWRPPGGWGSFENMERAGQLLAQARTLEPRSPRVLDVALYWLRTVGRCAEVIETAEHALRIDPNRTRGLTGLYNELAVCKTRKGHAEEELALQAQADELNPRSLFKFSRYRHMGFAALMLGRDQDAIGYLERSLAINPQASGLAWTYCMLAATHARLGHVDEAKRWLAQSVRLWPYITVRGVYPEELGSPVYAQQLRNYQAGLRLAGLRDHADEDAEFDVPPDALLRGEMAGQTPSEAPGVKTIRTAELVGLLPEAQPLVIDTVSNSWGKSIPGAIGLKFSGLAGSFTDEAQDRLRRKMAELTGSDVEKPIVAMGWNSERFDGRNLALRLAALGYTRVHWYRGGREAWEVAELPETELAVQEW
jgi:TolB-like protein/DNA-binding winged helix-turn-helix (wHTH) protein